MAEQVIYASRDLQRFDEPVAPVFIVGSFLGNLVITNERVLFLSSGGAGYSQVMASVVLGVLTPASLRSFEACVENAGGLSIPLNCVVSAAGHRRWDFGRYLRIDYVDAVCVPRQTSFIPRGVAGSGWIDEVVTAISS